MPKRTRICVRPTQRRKYKFEVVVPPEINEGARERKFFVTRKEAHALASDFQVRKENFGTRLLQMPEAVRQEASDCLEHLRPFGATLTQAVSFMFAICGRRKKTARSLRWSRSSHTRWTFRTLPA